MSPIRSLNSRFLRGIIPLWILIFAASVSINAQVADRQLPTVTIIFDAQVIDTDVFYFADAAFNLQNLVISPHSPVFVTINITADETVNVQFGIEIVADTDIAGSDIVIFSGVTRPVILTANQPRHFSNRDLGPGGRLEFSEYKTIKVTGGTESERKIVEVVRATSRLPEGTYNFYLTTYLVDEDSGRSEEVSQVVRPLRITNPSRVELLYPADGERLLTQFPHFQWRSDTRDVILRVFEFRPGMRSSEEAITGTPHLETRLSGRNELLYPQSGAGVRMLEPGKRYVWYLEAVYRTSANIEEGIISDLHAFTIADISQEGEKDAVWNLLERLLDDDYDIDEMIRRLRQEGIDPYIEIFLNGVPITIAEFQILIEAIRMGVNNARIINVTVRE